MKGNATAGGSGTVSVSGGATVTGTTTNGAPPWLSLLSTLSLRITPAYSASSGITGGDYNTSTGP